MSREIRWATRALRDLDALIPPIRDRILAAIEALAEADQGDVKKIQGTEDEWRLRVGDYRVRFTFAGPPPTILVLRILPRERAYR
jgi:mRNA interferase RelE/StbE